MSAIDDAGFGVGIMVPDGYTATELDRDNPYNQWMHEAETTEAENEDSLEEEDPDGDDGYCHTCAGTGEGQYDGGSCTACGGKGVRKAKSDANDYDPPEDDFEPCDGPL